MSVQNDDTLVTKGDLKTLYSDKIAPYLGGGINYYYTDRTGEELKCSEYTVSGTVPYAQPQSTTLTITNRVYDGISKKSDFTLNNNKIFIPEGMTVSMESQLYWNPGVTNKSVNTVVEFYDFTNSKRIDSTAAALVNAQGYSIPGAWSTIYTAPTGGAEVGLLCISSLSQVDINATNSRLIIKEIGRIVDPVKYVSNNSDLQETPIGNIISYMGNTVPKHYLACDGTLYSIGTYPELEAFITNEFGSINYFGGNGTTNWAVPDLRGEFLRGTGTNSHTDQGSGANVGVHQNATEESFVQIDKTNNIAFIGISNNINNTWTSANYDSVPKRSTPRTVYTLNKTVTTDSYSSDTPYTSRPTNTSVNYCIKYESTYHAFFSNAAYKVSVPFTGTAVEAQDGFLTLNTSSVVGDASLISNNKFVAPIDGIYIVSINTGYFTPPSTGRNIIYYNVNGSMKYADTSKYTNRGYSDFSSSLCLYLEKGDIVTPTLYGDGGFKNFAVSGDVEFALLTSNYNPTIVSADSVYSKNEQMIGYWEDGKPLYQKSIPFNPAIDISSTTWTNTTISKGDIERITYAEGWVNLSSGYQSRPMIAFVENGASIIKMLSGRDSVGQDTINGVTLRYTKTTDTASTLQVENSLLLNRPDLWEVGTEYHFGGGLYGQRFTGTITSSSGNAYVLGNVSGVTKIVNTGGHVSDSNWHLEIGNYWGSNNYISNIAYQSATNSFRINHYGYINNAYDVWVLYKK